jgi:DNA-directed RNA polymerase subunit RPC12/RpoP
MDKMADLTEFLCLRCGLQGLYEVIVSCSGHDTEQLCPRCGERVITAILLSGNKSSGFVMA